jgi:hypothetical protein
MITPNTPYITLISTFILFNYSCNDHYIATRHTNFKLRSNLNFDHFITSKPDLFHYFLTPTIMDLQLIDDLEDDLIEDIILQNLLQDLQSRQKDKSTYADRDSTVTG